MADIFVSYAREDIHFAKKLAKSLGRQGWSVWWDRRIAAGDRFNEVIAKQLEEARCVVTVWSSQSVGSGWVHDEAEYALKQKKLVPVLADSVDIPLGFRSIYAADLHGWRGSSRHRDFRRLIQDISERLGPGSRPEPYESARPWRFMPHVRLPNRQTLLSKKTYIVGLDKMETSEISAYNNTKNGY